MRRSLLLATAVFASGCAAEQGQRQATTDSTYVTRLATQAQTPAPFMDTSIVRSRPDQVYIGANVRQSSLDRTLPAEWRSRSVTFVNARPQGFREVLAMVSNTTKLPVSFSAAVSRQVAASAGQATADSTSTRPGLAPPTLATGPVPAGFSLSAAQARAAGAQPMAAAAPSSEGSLPLGRMNVNFTGTLSQFLDQVASNFGVSWSMDGERIVFSSVTTEVFDIPALPVVLKLATQFSSQGPSLTGGGGSTGGLSGGSGGSGGSNSDSVNSSTAVDLWKEINSALRSIVTQGNGGLDVSGSTGTVTVTGSRDTVQNVRRYVSEINSRLSKQVVLSLAVYSVSLQRQDQVSSNVAPILQAGGLRVLGATAAQPFTGTAAITGRAGPAIGLVLDATRDPTNTLSGSQALVEALSRAGEVSVVNSQSITTMNNIPVPFRDVNTRGYAAQVSTTTVATAAAALPQTSIIPGTVQTGYSIRLTPRINNDGTVLLEYALDLSELNGPQEGFRTFSTGSQTIQLPDVNSRNGVGQARIPAGSTLVLTGLERTRVDSTRTGPGTPNAFMLGGSRGGGVRRELIVITVTPEIIDFGSPRASR
jgi:type IVB pilus formation R64 PilN family outer membrane protein